MKLIEIMKMLINYFKRIYRLSLNIQKQEEIVWKDLKKLHSDANWDSGIYEKDKYIETIFKIHEGKLSTFYYMIYDGYYHCTVKVLENFNPDLTVDLFVLAAHFNNLLNNGVVVINVTGGYVEYKYKKDLLIPLLNSGDIERQLGQHYSTTKDIYSAFQRLVNEQEAPAIIIADLLESNKKRDDEAE